MDHISHVSKWEELGASIHFPYPHQNNLISLDAFLEDFGFLKELNKPIAEILGSLNHYVPCKRDPIVFQPGDILTFDNLEIQTIPLEGHSRGMVGFFFPFEKLIHISCLGFDIQKPGDDQFGPWYGFEECSLELYNENIDTVEKIFLNSSDILTSSHSYVVREKNSKTFDYMRRKIKQNHEKIMNAVLEYKKKGLDGDLIEYLLSLDLIYPKYKMKEPLRSTFRFWESWIIKNHLNSKTNS
jgi:glyoxylase-like metal-dependent hydrolase (beta-lactamase superfamily II)